MYYNYKPTRTSKMTPAELKCIRTKFEGLGGKDSDSCFADVIELILEHAKFDVCETFEIFNNLSTSHDPIWKYLRGVWDPETHVSSHTGVWNAFETFVKTNCVNLTEEEDKTNACVKWLHEIIIRVMNLEATDDLFGGRLYARHRNIFEQIRHRLDEIIEYELHKLRCFNFQI